MTNFGLQGSSDKDYIFCAFYQLCLVRVGLGSSKRYICKRTCMYCHASIIFDGNEQGIVTCNKSVNDIRGHHLDHTIPILSPVTAYFQLEVFLELFCCWHISWHTCKDKLMVKWTPRLIGYFSLEEWLYHVLLNLQIQMLHRMYELQVTKRGWQSRGLFKQVSTCSLWQGIAQRLV